MTRDRTARAGIGALLAAASAVALGACVSTPPAVPARVARPVQSYAADKALASTPNSSKEGRDWPADAWWRAYGDPQLDALMAEALAGSPTLAVAEARIRKAMALENHGRLMPVKPPRGLVV